VRERGLALLGCGGVLGQAQRKTKAGHKERKKSSGPGRRLGGEKFFLFSKSFSILHKTKFKCKPNQIQIWFKIHFSLQIKMRNFGKFSKNKFYNF